MALSFDLAKFFMEQDRHFDNGYGIAIVMRKEMFTSTLLSHTEAKRTVRLGGMTESAALHKLAR